MGTITSRPGLFAVDSHYDEAGDWVNTGTAGGVSFEPNSDGVRLATGTAHEGDFADLTYSEAHQLALWLLATVESRGES